MTKHYSFIGWNKNPAPSIIATPGYGWRSADGKSIGVADGTSMQIWRGGIGWSAVMTPPSGARNFAAPVSHVHNDCVAWVSTSGAIWRGNLLTGEVTMTFNPQYPNFGSKFYPPSGNPFYASAPRVGPAFAYMYFDFAPQCFFSYFSTPVMGGAVLIGFNISNGMPAYCIVTDLAESIAGYFLQYNGGQVFNTGSTSRTEPTAFLLPNRLFMVKVGGGGYIDGFMPGDIPALAANNGFFASSLVVSDTIVYGSDISSAKITGQVRGTTIIMNKNHPTSSSWYHYSGAIGGLYYGTWQSYPSPGQRLAATIAAANAGGIGFMSRPALAMGAAIAVTDISGVNTYAGIYYAPYDDLSIGLPIYVPAPAGLGSQTILTNIENTPYLLDQFGNFYNLQIAGYDFDRIDALNWTRDWRA